MTVLRVTLNGQQPSSTNIIMYRVNLTLISLLLITFASFTKADNNQEDVGVHQLGKFIGNAVKFVEACGNKDITVCLKERALKYLENTSGNIELADGVTLKDTNPEKDETQNVSNPALPEEPRARENAIDSLLMDRLSKFFGSHTLEFKIPTNSITEMKREFDADEGRKKKKKKLLPILGLLAVKAAILLPLAIGAIALAAFKALVIGKIALVISGLIALKKIFESKESSQTYEVVAHPHHSHSHVSSFDHDHHGHYRRALLVEDPQNIPYSAYVGNQQLMFGNEK